MSRSPETSATSAELDWPALLLRQLEHHWTGQLRPRLEGLTDDEWSWEPVPGCWGVRPRGSSKEPISVGAGDWTIDFAMPEPEPPPVTTIAWRMAHLVVGCLGGRAVNHFGADGGLTDDYRAFRYAGSADEALTQLDHAYRAWTDGVRSMDAEALAAPAGEAEGPYAAYPMAELVLHVNRETIHHGAEIALLRDLYAHEMAERWSDARTD